MAKALVRMVGNLHSISPQGSARHSRQCSPSVSPSSPCKQSATSRDAPARSWIFKLRAHSPVKYSHLFQMSWRGHRFLADPSFCFWTLAMSPFRRSRFRSIATNSSRTLVTLSSNSSKGVGSARWLLGLGHDPEVYMVPTAAVGTLACRNNKKAPDTLGAVATGQFYFPTLPYVVWPSVFSEQPRSSRARPYSWCAVALCH
jgi:hypothetical protein